MRNYTKVGEGTFGSVYIVKSPGTGNKYAWKRNFAELDTSFISVIREANMLCYLNNHPNIVGLKKISFDQHPANTCFSPIDIKARHNQKNDVLHFLFEPADHDLHAFIHDMTCIDFKLCKQYMVQMLLAVEFMHNSGIIHRDLKPSNILIVNDPENGSQIKICDFGLSKPYTYQGSQTPNTLTSWYRSPEVAVGFPNYDFKVDIWSMGCIFYELLTKSVLVYTKKDDNDLIISTILGILSEELPTRQFRTWVSSGKWRKIKLQPCYKPSCRKTLKERIIAQFTPELLAKLELNINLDDFCNLLELMLKFDYRERITATECLDHVFFADYKPLIDKVREDNKPRKCEEIVRVHNCQERTWMSMIVYEIFNNRHLLKWYTHRLLFQAIDIWDRYLETMFKYGNFPPNAVESEVRGLLHDERETELRFITCIYICIKFFSSLQYPIRFDEIISDTFKTPEDLATAQAFEEAIVVDCLDFMVYRDTVYEAADYFGDNLSDEDVRSLLMFFASNPSISGYTPIQLYEYYRTNLKNVDLQLLSQPFTIPN